MKTSTKAALIALSLALLPLSAQASSRVVVDFGAIAFGYRDGYWDRDQHWHRWRRHDDWARYHRDYREHAYDWRHDDRRHDDDHHHGWRDDDRYWDHH